MTQDLALFLLFATSGLIQYGCLLLNMDTKNTIWKRAIMGGMIGSGVAAIGIYVPQYIPIPCTIFASGTVWMLANVFLSYYNAPMADNSTEQQLEDRRDIKHNTVTQLAFGLVMLLVVSVIVAFTQGQQDSTRVQVGVRGAIERLADEVGTLSRRISRVESDVTDLKKGQTKSAAGDSVARKQSFKNQAELLKRRR